MLATVGRRLSHVTVPWCVVADWALNLFTGDATRDRSDIEKAVPADQFDQVVDALPGSNGM
jgi:uncharacterized protein CbrC (UPF0167 family)